MKLHSAWYCPFAQRAWMTLIHKNIPFEYIETDPYLITDEWLEISQNTGQVPVLMQESSAGHETSIVDSNTILKFLDQHEGEGFSLSSNGFQNQDDTRHFGICAADAKKQRKFRALFLRR
tara:strand:+ start:1221 stop:1580 length:360 start_codon:yes stop_codon:yes gene_type:complete